MPRAALRTCLTASGLVAVVACSVVACSVATKVDYVQCEASVDCRGAFGLGWVCGDAGLCEQVKAEPRCARVYPDDLFSKPEEYADAIVFGTLFDHNTEDGDLKLVNAASLAISEANDSGLTGGRRFGIVHCDYQENDKLDERSSQEAAVAMASYLKDELGVPAIVGPGTSDLASAVFSELQDPSHAPAPVIISPSATSPSLTNIDVRDGDKPGLFWRTVPSDLQLGFDLADFMSAQGIKRGTVIYESGTYGVGLFEAIQSNFDGELGQLVFKTEADIPDRVAELSGGKGADDIGIVFIGSQVAQVTAFINAASPYDYFVESRIFLGDAAYNDDVLTGTSASTNLYPRILGVFPGAPTGNIYQAFISRYKFAYKEDPTDASYSAYTYDATWMALYGTAWAEFQRDGELTGLNLAYGLQRISDTKGFKASVGVSAWNDVKSEFKAGNSIDITGASGDLQYDPKTEETTAKPIYWKIKADGSDFEDFE